MIALILRQLNFREQQFRGVFFDAADAMLILDDHRAILEANPSACALFGVEADGIVGESLDALLVGDEQLHAAWRELLALGEARREHRVRSRTPGDDGRIVSAACAFAIRGLAIACVSLGVKFRLLELRARGKRISGLTALSVGAEGGKL